LSPGEAFEAGPVPLTIGRSEDNAVPLDGDEFASAHHARIEAARDGVWILDLNSTNGTWVNGERLDGRHRLRQGDVVQIGDTELRFEQ
jgi:pSer/pThr/pTyr-binding forkhead associated (FHA) protein